MRVRSCTHPWRWLLVTHTGEVMPCSHGARPVGNLNTESIEAIWNGPVMQDLRRSILAGQVHEVCRCSGCPFLTEDRVFEAPAQPLQLDPDTAGRFDEEDYLAEHADVRAAVRERTLDSGLEHFVLHGRAEGRAHRLRPEFRPGSWSNAVATLLEYSAGHVRLAATPSDLVLAVTTVCNLKCVMCPHGMDLVPSKRHMPAEVVDRLGGFLRRAVRVIASGIGEPTLAPAFWSLVAAVCARTDLFLRTNSNGHFVSNQVAARLLDSGLTEISFSLDAATPGTYRRIRGSRLGDALRGIANLVRLRRSQPAARLKVYVNMTLMRENLGEAPRLVRLAKLLRVDGVVFTQLFAFGEQPDWRVHRGHWTFVYAEQSPSQDRPGMVAAVQRIQAAGARLGMPVLLRDNVARYA
jgi:radical SAM protein with 4Fe4S-binding SPASM domain